MPITTTPAPSPPPNSAATVTSPHYPLLMASFAASAAAQATAMIPMSTHPGSEGSAHTGVISLFHPNISMEVAVSLDSTPPYR